MIEARALSVRSAKSPVEVVTIQRRDVGEHDVLLEIQHSGICHSDIHSARGEWQETLFPLVPGHEIVGVVVDAGPAVTRFTVGQRVGVGYLVDSCRKCENCLAGEEQYCLRGEVRTYNCLDRDGNPTLGGYSSAIVVDENFVLAMPDGLDGAVAAPLLCAGITVFSPLRRWSAGPGVRVAVIGLGGLGHLGVLLAKALGAEVSVLSRTSAKRDDALALGAEHFYGTGDRAVFDAQRSYFDLILNTSSGTLDLDSHLGLLRRNGTMVDLGLPGRQSSYDAFSLVFNGRALAGSTTGGIRETQEMLDLCGRLGIGAEVETVGPDEVDSAFDRVVEGRVRYRFVIDMAGFGR